MPGNASSPPTLLPPSSGQLELILSPVLASVRMAMNSENQCMLIQEVKEKSMIAFLVECHAIMDWVGVHRLIFLHTCRFQCSVIYKSCIPKRITKASG